MITVRETEITYAGNEYKIHPAGTGNPQNDRITELICENLPASENIALIECGTGVIAHQVEGDCTCFHSNWIDYCYGKKNAPKAVHHFEDFAVTETTALFDTILFRITKSSTHNQLIIAKALKQLTSEGKLYIAGGNKEGIKGVVSKLKKAGIDSAVFANGGGGRILELDSSQKLSVEQETIATVYPLGGKELTVNTQEGLFAYGKTDRGSALLIKHLHTFNKKKVLDLGCGSGILSVAALALDAESVTATDISAMAVNASTANLPTAENVIVEPSYIGDCYSDRFDIILTNPPFHEGKGTTNTLGAEWLDRCQELLAGNGELYLVANLFLPYFRWGQERFNSVEELETADGFVVYRMKSPMRKKSR